MNNSPFVREREPVVHQVMVMSVMYMAATQQWLDLPPEPCTGAVFIHEVDAVRYATSKNLEDLIRARGLLERFGFGIVEPFTSFDYYFVRTRPAAGTELAVLFWDGAT